MSDLLDVLPDFNVKPFSHLLHSLEKNDISVSDLLSLDPIEIARKCPLPLLDVRALVHAVIKALQDHIRIRSTRSTPSRAKFPSIGGVTDLAASRFADREAEAIVSVKTLDAELDAALGGGFRPGHIVEVVGESAAGKTQLVFGLLLSVQLPQPQGYGKSAIYLSTEAPLNTTRLLQILESHPTYTLLPASDRPTLDRIHTMSTNDLEAQEHVIQYQISIAVKKFQVGLIVLDSVAANFRAEHETKSASGLADRARDLSNLGSILRRVAIEDQVVIITTNQVSDRFEDNHTKVMQERLRSSSPGSTSSPATQGMSLPEAAQQRIALLSLDHQQRFFTGWGDGTGTAHQDLKTPALGLAWANQISARIVLKLESTVGADFRLGYDEGSIWRDRKRRRFMSVVFAPWAEPTRKSVEYEIHSQGLVSLVAGEMGEEIVGNGPAETQSLDVWGFDGVDEDEEFP